MAVMIKAVRSKRLPPEDQIQLIAEAQRGDAAARDAVVLATFGLVVKRASRLRGIDASADVDDLVQEGIVGLLTAIDRFDCSRGVRFITYAQPWIDQSIRRALWRHREVGMHVVNASKIVEEFRSLEVELGPEAAAKEVAARHGMRESSVREYSEDLRRGRSYSLDAPVLPDDRDSPALVETLPDRAGASPDDAAAALELRDEMEAALRGVASLGPRFAAVLERRILADPGDAAKLHEIGDAFGVSRERVRQHQVEAVAALRKAVWKSPVLSDAFGLGEKRRAGAA